MSLFKKKKNLSAIKQMIDVEMVRVREFQKHIFYLSVKDEEVEEARSYFQKKYHGTMTADYKTDNTIVYKFSSYD